MLDELAGAVQETIQELRELAHGIYPPLLVDSGLGEALRAVANRSPLDVEVVTEGIGRYDGEVEAAVYFCCLEALQNAGKHAADAHVEVRVSRTRAVCCSRWPTTDLGSTSSARSVATASSTWRTASGRSAARCAGSPAPARARRSRGTVPIG